MSYHLRKFRFARMLAIVVVSAFVAAACGSHHNDASSGTVTPAGASRIAEATQAPLTPEPAGDGDCPQGYVRYRHPAGSMSLCAPEQVTGFSQVTGSGDLVLLLTSDEEFSVPAVPRVTLAVALSDEGFGEEAPIAELCQSQNESEVRMPIAGYTARGCSGTQDTQSEFGPAGSLQVTIALPPGDGSSFAFAHLSVHWRTQSPGAKELADQIIQSLSIQG